MGWLYAVVLNLDDAGTLYAPDSIDGVTLGTLGPPDDSLLSPELSPDGRRVAVQRKVQNNEDIWILDALRTIRFTFDAGSDRFPIWSPDGSRIVFT